MQKFIKIKKYLSKIIVYVFTAKVLKLYFAKDYNISRHHVNLLNKLLPKIKMK